jgi:hypothetical protein
MAFSPDGPHLCRDRRLTDANTRLLLFAPAVRCQALRLVHVQDRDHEEHHQSANGVRQITPHLGELCILSSVGTVPMGWPAK